MLSRFFIIHPFPISIMNPFLRILFRSILFACLVTQLSTLKAQNQTPPPQPGQSPTPKYTEEQIREMVAKLQQRVGKATDQVMGRIKKQEDDLQVRFSYFRKPDRLNPATYSSKEDVAQWQQSLQRLKESADIVEKLYTYADQDLGNALIQQRINQPIAEQIKNELLRSFPWEIIKKKNQLLKEFVAEFGDLLTFYYKNWGSWKTGSSTSAPTFDEPKLASAYQGLKDKINATSSQIEDQYKRMTQ
jgi:hypothetical protein